MLMKQMKSFSEVMPEITDQIIVFINDKYCLMATILTSLGFIALIREVP